MADGSRMALDLGDRTQTIAYLIRRYDAEIAAYICSRLPDGGVFFDLGANVGLVTFAVARRRPDVRIVAFEPNPPNVQRWKQNRDLNQSAAELVPAAVGAEAGTAHLTLDTAADSGSGRLADHGTPVEVVTLDEQCARLGVDRVDVMKLDIQGHEPEALAGATGLLERGAIRSLVLEEVDADPALHERLVGYGFRREPIPPVGLRRLRRSPPMGDVAYVL